MNEANKPILLEVLTEILEQFAFVFVEEEPGPVDPPENGTPLLAEISFSSQRLSGKLVLAASRPLCSEMAQNVLGEDDQDNLPRNASRNALQEVVNIACGNILARLYGTKEMFELSVPNCREISPEQWRKLGHKEGTIHLSAEEEPLLLQLIQGKGEKEK
jgi:hypothetical protein